MRAVISSILILCSSFAFCLESEVSRTQTESLKAYHDVVAALPFRTEARAGSRDLSVHPALLSWIVAAFDFSFSPRVLSLSFVSRDSASQVSSFHVWARGPPHV